jgi:hypothetical protein
MMLCTRIAVTGLCAALIAPSSLNAATVSKEGGTVLISKGEGFAPIAGDAQLIAGNQVMVRPGGMATIAYGAACTVRVGSGVWLVQEKAPCAPGTTMIDFTGRMNQQPPGDPPADPPGDPPADTAGGGIDTTTGLVIGGVVIAGGVGLGLLLSNDSKDDKPASP